MNKVVVVIILASVGAALLAGIWFAVRAACRKLGLGQNHQILIAGTFCLAPFVIWPLATLDRLDDLETTCRSELLKTQRMADATGVQIKEHYDFWTKTMSGGGFAMPWISKPYEDPKVVLVVGFTQVDRTHESWIECAFSRVPNTGDPPQVTFKEVKISDHF